MQRNANCPMPALRKIIAFVAECGRSYQPLIVKSLEIDSCVCGEYRGHRLTRFFPNRRAVLDRYPSGRIGRRPRFLV
jgi:hypothetical protein